VLITIHTDPDTANQEISDLPKVVDDAKSRYQGEGDFIIMGDLNADCTYFKENNQSPLRSSDYYWVINNSVDTTTKSTDCTYDRIIITNPLKRIVKKFCVGNINISLKYPNQMHPTCR
jgi:deoxyribonuclease-1-like protein